MLQSSEFLMSLEKIREKMASEDIDCVILTGESNVLYATGEKFKGYIFVTQEDVDIIASRFYQYDLEGFSPDYAYSRKDYGDLLEERENRYEGEIVTGSDSDKLEEIFDAEKTGFMQEVRKTKTEEEIDKVRRACEITDQAFEKVRPQLFSGVTEWEAVSVLKQHYCEEGVKESFITMKDQSIVHRNCLRPHRGPEKKTVEEDDMVIVDTGAQYRGYCADVTRTYCKNPSQEQQELFDTVKQIQDDLLEMIEPGVEIANIEEREIELMEEHGYSPRKHKLHTTGHSVGIEVHERPSLHGDVEGELEEGMVLAVEPALYVPGVGSCRIEDTVLVTAEGVERLSKAPREL